MSELRLQWGIFHGGEWRRDFTPTEQGTYYCATLDGGRVLLRYWRHDPDGVIRDSHVGPNEPGWRGWIWTQPLPALPTQPVPEV